MIQPLGAAELKEEWPKDDGGVLAANLIERHLVTRLIDICDASECADRCQAEMGAAKAIAAEIKQVVTVPIMTVGLIDADSGERSELRQIVRDLRKRVEIVGGNDACAGKERNWSGSGHDGASSSGKKNIRRHRNVWRLHTPAVGRQRPTIRPVL